MQVARRGGDVGMPEQALDDVDVGTAPQQARGVGVAPAVGEVATTHPGPGAGALDQLGHRHRAVASLVAVALMRRGVDEEEGRRGRRGAKDGEVLACRDSQNEGRSRARHGDYERAAFLRRANGPRAPFPGPCCCLIWFRPGCPERRVDHLGDVQREPPGSRLYRSARARLGVYLGRECRVSSATIRLKRGS